MQIQIFEENSKYFNSEWNALESFDNKLPIIT